MRSPTVTLLGVVTLLSYNTIVLVAQHTAGCGNRNTGGILRRSFGDIDIESMYGEFPWMMAILETKEVVGMPNQSVYLCGGSLIHEQVVLTAAHSLNNKQPFDLKVRAGEWDMKGENETYPHQDRSVVEIVIHPTHHKGHLYNDVALLFLDSPIKLNRMIQPVCLPPQDAKFDNQTRCVVTGWGKDHDGKGGTYQTILKQIDLPIMPNEECELAFQATRLGPKFTLHQSFICAGGEKGKDTCKGDGGSPLVCPNPNKLDQYYQTGVVAWGVSCGEDGVPGAYANVAIFREWIDQQMIQRNYGTSSYTA